MKTSCEKPGLRNRIPNSEISCECGNQYLLFFQKGLLIMRHRQTDIIFHFYKSFRKLSFYQIS